MTFTVFSDSGARPVNDDFASSRAKKGIYCFAVSDGMGENGSIAAHLTVNTILHEFDKKPAVSASALKSYITEAQKKLLIKKSEDPRLDTAAATVAVLITNGSEAILGSVGDTRIYVLNRSKISEVTEDHSAAFELFENGDIEYDEIRTNRDRHKLRRAIGDRISWEPDISEVFKINSAFSFLICTDGFWNLIHDTEIERARMLSSSSKGWLKKMLAKITPRITHGSDNLTAAAICIQKADVI